MTQVLLDQFPGTVELAIAALFFAVVVGIPLGYFAARRQGSALDGTSVVGSLIGITIPVFFLAFLLKYVFAVKLGWLPPSGRQDPRIDATHITNFFVLDGVLTREWDAAWDAVRHLILPAIALGTIPLAIIVRITRASVLDVVNEDYVRTAEAKGLTTAVIRRRHVLRNSMLPVVTTIGLQLGLLLSGAILTETGVLVPGDRPGDRRRDLQQGLPVAAGCDPVHRGAVRADQPGRRHPVRSPRPEGEGPVTTATQVDAAGVFTPEEVVGGRWKEAFRRLRRDPMAIIGALLVLLFVLVAIFAPLLAPHDPNEQLLIGEVRPDFIPGAQPGFPLGADQLGRDELSRLLVRCPPVAPGRRGVDDPRADRSG